MKGTVRKQNGSWYCIYRVEGRQVWKKGGSTKKEAECMLAEIMHDLNNGTYKKIEEIGFRDFAKLWVETYAKTKCKPSTLRSYEDIIKVHLELFFANTALTGITPAKVQQYVSSKLNEKILNKDNMLVPRLSPKSINNHIVPLKEMLKHAVRWGYLKENPAEHVEKPRVEHKEMDFLSPEEIRLFLQHVRPEYYAFFLMAVLTGLRRGELLGLTWGDIEFATNTIHVRRALYKDQFITPKSKNSKRKVIMTPLLASILKEHKLKSIPNEMDLIFTKCNGKPLDPDKFVRTEFLPALRRAGLRRVRFHDLRHTFATLLISQGENVKFIQSQLGHASIQTTLDRYGHLLPEIHNEAGSKLDKVVGINRQQDTMHNEIRSIEAVKLSAQH
ncbi:MAG: site-specific integrase [Deltaproteobacteria bacterium]|nr:site-specific integrase [Deltaproteobacteria bacterium]